MEPTTLKAVKQARAEYETNLAVLPGGKSNRTTRQSLERYNRVANDWMQDHPGQSLSEKIGMSVAL
mgnify:FL=1